MMVRPLQRLRELNDAKLDRQALRDDDLNPYRYLIKEHYQLCKIILIPAIKQL